MLTFSPLLIWKIQIVTHALILLILTSSIPYRWRMSVLSRKPGVRWCCITAASRSIRKTRNATSRSPIELQRIVSPERLSASTIIVNPSSQHFQLSKTMDELDGCWIFIVAWWWSEMSIPKISIDLKKVTATASSTQLFTSSSIPHTRSSQWPRWLNTSYTIN